MDRLIENLLRVDEQLSNGEVGFIDLSGSVIRFKGYHHELYIRDYLKKRRLKIPKSEEEMKGKFLGLTKYVRYYAGLVGIGSRMVTEADFSMVGPINSAQISTIRRLAGGAELVVFDIVDREGNILQAGNELSNLISSLKKMNLLERIV